MGIIDQLVLFIPEFIRRGIVSALPDHWVRILTRCLHPEQYRNVREYAFEASHALMLRIEKYGFVERGIRDLETMAREHPRNFFRQGAAWQLCLWYAPNGPDPNQEKCRKWQAVAQRGVINSALRLQMRRIRKMVARGKASPIKASGLNKKLTPHAAVQKKEQINHEFYDVIIISDFCLAGGTNGSNAEEIRVQTKMGLKTGLFHLPRYENSPQRSVNSKIKRCIQSPLVRLLSSSGHYKCDLLLIRYPPVLQERSVKVPDINAKTIRVIVNQVPMSSYSSLGERMYEPGTCQRNLKEYFRGDAVWAPNSPMVRDTLRLYHAHEFKNISLEECDWVNMIDTSEWKRDKRPQQNGVIRIGRHSGNHPLKWPETTEDLFKAYPNDPKYEVRVLGGLSTLRKMVKNIPCNWSLYEFGQVDVRVFLSGLDIYI